MKILQYNQTDEFTKSERQSLGVLGLTLLLATSYIFGSGADASATEAALVSQTSRVEEMTDNKIDDFFESLELKASSVLILDSTTKQTIYGKDTQTVMPLASLTKIMTAIVALEQIGVGEMITIPKEALALTGDNGLLVDEKWGRDELLRFMLITSSNDATRALSLHVGKKAGFQTQEESVQYFVDLMNAKTHMFGLTNTHFLNESGLDEEDGKNGGYSTSAEIVKLFDYAISTYPDIFSSTSFGSQVFVSASNTSHKALNTNPNPGLVAGISASKTGFTNISGGNLIVSFKTPEGKTIIANVLGSTFAHRFTDIEKLSSITLKLIHEVQL